MNLCPGWLHSWILLICASPVARITGMNHRSLNFFFNKIKIPKYFPQPGTNVAHAYNPSYLAEQRSGGSGFVASLAK
jgi:hypothetical protein